MKKNVILLITLFLCFHFPQQTFANGAGLPSFFEINGILSSPNPLQLFGVTASSFLIPQDYAPQTYVVNEPINFVVDKQKLAGLIPQNLLDRTTFSWDFGDGVKAQDLQNTHTYTKIGSYILILTIDVPTGDAQPTKFIDSYLLQILPTKDYKGLPTAVIKVNGSTIKKASGNPTLSLNFQNPISFDASSSKASSPIVEYLWDFGDGVTGSKPSVTHTYNSYIQQHGIIETVVLRVKDQHGFISDAYVGLVNTAGSVDMSGSNGQQSTTPGGFSVKDILVSALILVFLFTLGWIIYLNKHAKHP